MTPIAIRFLDDRTVDVNAKFGGKISREQQQKKYVNFESKEWLESSACCINIMKERYNTKKYAAIKIG